MRAYGFPGGFLDYRDVSEITGVTFEVTLE